ncbi:hypothetical protein PoB_007193500 [Plakobranchus ocellatus]|uniref:Uncharacterized protein n=1 Tax=Plakobranchus ocellatus TaxID=259542 RepID=A0AAV4DMR2_9GAST|nr:hypothetical protein PoB_007193500 [Plakobranchus ocellatus]
MHIKPGTTIPRQCVKCDMDSLRIGPGQVLNEAVDDFRSSPQSEASDDFTHVDQIQMKVCYYHNDMKTASGA